MSDVQERKPAEVQAKKKRKPEPIGIRAKWANGSILFTPATASDLERIKAKKIGDNDLVFFEFKKPRSVGFHRLAHALGRMVVENVEDFDHLTPHEALKRLQVEANAGCEILMVEMSTIWRDVAEWIAVNLGKSFADVLTVSLKSMGVKSRMVPVRVPRSLSFDSMDQEEFFVVLHTMCKYIAKRYWTSMSAEEIEQMAEAMGRELLA